MDRLISLQAAIDALGDEPEFWTGKDEYAMGLNNQWHYDRNAIKAVPSAQSDLIAKIQNGIKATDADDAYSCGMRNGMRWCKSLIDGKEPLYENCPSAQPTEASCWGCNCQKMERLKEQKTFSEMVHLHDAETHEERTETREMLESAQPEPHYDEWCTDCKEYDTDKHCCPRWNRVIRQTLKDAQPETQWIPCSARLPEEDVEVLISYRYKDGEGDTSHIDIDITTYGQMYFGGNKVGNHKHWRAPFEYFESNYEVVAWMPLPEPWRGEEHG